MIKFFPILLLVAGGITLTAGDIFMKEWVNSNRRLFYLIGLVIYMIGMLFLAQSFKHKNIAVASVMLVLFNVISLSIVSWLYFKEGLTGWQLFGILLGLSSVVVLELTGKSA
ncbi:MAG: SMR family transporter [Patescibacteria group bacterium]|jgi:multidrug transporter EmrE-like cation transporter